jgi:hypothetical protein
MYLYWLRCKGKGIVLNVANLFSSFCYFFLGVRGDWGNLGLRLGSKWCLATARRRS